MHQVTAYEDECGYLHKTKRDAIVAEFIYKMQKVWGTMPSQRDQGDPVVIARILVSPTYEGTREALTLALAYLNTELASID